jgi:hypothetical protein
MHHNQRPTRRLGTRWECRKSNAHGVDVLLLRNRIVPEWIGTNTWRNGRTEVDVKNEVRICTSGQSANQSADLCAPTLLKGDE